jgi:hypothetical protein
MPSLQTLFAETSDYNIDSKHLKKVSKVCSRLGSAENLLPSMSYPSVNSAAFDNDLDEVVRCIKHPHMDNRFIKCSDGSVEETFKSFLEREHNDFIDWSEISKLLEEVDTIVLRLKYEYKRPRPKCFLIDVSDRYRTIKDSKSPSFPSGHTAIAYFLSGILSKLIPELTGDLLTLSEMVGQSRIENGVHFPSDILYGRLVGEMLSDSYNNEERRIIDGLKRNHYRECSQNLRDVAEKIRPSHLKVDALDSYARDLAQYIFRTNQIERYSLDFDDCNQSAREFLMGYPSDYVTDDKHISSTLDGIVYTNLLETIDSPQKIIQTHRAFHPDVIERQAPGSLRDFSHASPSGTAYSEPQDILHCLKQCCKIKDQPVLKHIVYEWVHPFCDGNGRSGRLILASDLGYNFDIANQVIDDNYIPMLREFMENTDMNDLVNSL